MENPEPTPLPPPPRTLSASSEGIIGIGITVAGLGVLCLLLGCAQWMRLEHQVAFIFLPLGALLVAAGAVTAMIGQLRNRQ